MRTIKRCNPKINERKLAAFLCLSKAYAKEKNHHLDALRSCINQSLLGSPRKLRDELVKKQYKSPFGLQARHWKLALQDAAETWDKYWQALFQKIRPKIYRRKDFTDDDRHYCHWLLAGYAQFSALLQKQTPKPSFSTASDLKRLANYVRNLVQKNKGKAPIVRKTSHIKFDADCYEVFEHKGVQYIKLMTLTPGKRLSIPLKGHTKIEGNISVALQEKSLEIHVSQNLKKKAPAKEKRISVDFGFTEVMTDKENNRYGKNFGSILIKASEKRHLKMQKRNKLYALEKKAKNRFKAKNIRKYNLGRRKLTSQKRKATASIEREINTGLNELIATVQPSLLITEDLRHAFTFARPKSVNRKLSNWTKGKLQDRVAFKALAEGFRHEQVNAAYSSQECISCGFVDPGNRTGDAFNCLNCRHKDYADRVSAVNLDRRYDDPEIGRYMPYHQVKIILQERFKRRLEKEKSLTVHGMTLDTVGRCVHHPIEIKS